MSNKVNFNAERVSGKGGCKNYVYTELGLKQALRWGEVDSIRSNLVEGLFTTIKIVMYKR